MKECKFQMEMLGTSAIGSILGIKESILYFYLFKELGVKRWFHL